MKWIAILSLVALAGCVDSQPNPAVQPVADTCGATALQSLIGQDRNVLQTMKFAGPLRVLEPKAPMTMDYLITRTNVELDASGKIIAVTCG